MITARLPTILLPIGLAALAGGCSLLLPAGPEPPPGLLGSLQGGDYIARDGAFRVALPHDPRSEEARGLDLHDDVTETETERLSSVAFGPGPTDPAIYRVALSTWAADKPDPRSLADRADLIMSSYMVRYDDEFGGLGEQMVRRELKIDGRDAVYAVYRYDPPDADQRGFFVVFQFVKLTQSQLLNVMAARWTAESPWHPGVELLVERRWQRFLDFASSVRLPGR